MEENISYFASQTKNPEAGDQGELAKMKYEKPFQQHLESTISKTPSLQQKTMKKEPKPT